MEINEWQGCYPSQWKGLIVPGAMSHPAKFSSKLIRRIYDHMIDEGWLRIGDRVIDPFGGVALGALEAMRHGLQWQGIELEAKFVDLGGQNIDLWNKKFGRMPHWGGAKLTQGDSRFILKILSGEQQGVVSSPPYSDGSQHTGGNDPHPEKMQGGTFYGVGLNGSVSSPPYADSLSVDLLNSEERNKIAKEKQIGAEFINPIDLRVDGKRNDIDYGSTPGQLGAMQSGDFSAAITSPPFRQSEGGTPDPKPGGPIDERLYARHAAGNSAADGYGTTPGNLANMDEPKDDFMAAVSSPPYENTDLGGGAGILARDEKMRKTHGMALDDFNYGKTEGNISNLPAGDFEGAVSSPPFENSRSRDFMDAETRVKFARENGITNAEFISPIDMDRLKAPDDIYGDTEGQIGNDSGETFWQAARQIVEQVYLALAPGGHAVWVVKNYVKNKQIVPFCDQWRQLCEAVGFVTIHEHHAMLVHNKGASHTLEGGVVEHKTESKSFFRRLAEKNGSPRIDYEVVFCMVKPEGE